MNNTIAVEPELAGHTAVRLIEEDLRHRSTTEWSSFLPLFREIARTDFATQATEQALRKISRLPSYQLGRFSQERDAGGWTIATTPHFMASIGIRVAAQQRVADGEIGYSLSEQSLLTQPAAYDNFFKILKVDYCFMEHYEVVAAKSNSEHPTLTLTSRHQLRTGEELLLRRGVDATIARLNGAFVYLEFTGREAESLLPRFNITNKGFHSWIGGDPSTSRIELLTRVLADFSASEHISILQGLSEHPDHFVRWNSIRHLIRIDADVGMRHVQQATMDPHADVREAARRTLAVMRKGEA